MYSDSPKAKRVEFRCPDPSCNPYLAFAAMLMAGLDGIQNRIDPGDPLDKDIYDLPPEELAEIPTVPGSLGEALAALEADHEFLLEGDVFTQDFIENYPRVQAREGGRPDPPAPAPLRVRAVLRHLSRLRQAAPAGFIRAAGSPAGRPETATQLAAAALSRPPAA